VTICGEARLLRNASDEWLARAAVDKRFLQIQIAFVPRYNQPLIRARARGTLRRSGGRLSGFFSVAM
jgi:hypothetical protein